MLKFASFAAAAAVLTAVLAAAPANAAPFSPVKPGIEAAGVTTIADGCGRFRHFSPRYGRCVRNWRPWY